MIEATVLELIKVFQDMFREMYPEIFDGLSDEDVTEELTQRVIWNAGSIVQLSKLPAIVLNGPLLTEKHRLNRDPERITEIDKTTGQAVREVPPRWYDLHFDVNFSCESNIDLIRLIEMFSRLNQGYALLSAKNERERQYVWRWETPPQNSTNPNISQVYQGRTGVIVYDVEVYSGLQKTVPLIGKVIAEIDKDRIEVQQ